MFDPRYHILRSIQKLSGSRVSATYNNLNNLFAFEQELLDKMRIEDLVGYVSPNDPSIPPDSIWFVRDLGRAYISAYRSERFKHVPVIVSLLIGGTGLFLSILTRLGL